MCACQMVPNKHYNVLYQMFGKENEIMHSLSDARDTAIA